MKRVRIALSVIFVFAASFPRGGALSAEPTLPSLRVLVAGNSDSGKSGLAGAHVVLTGPDGKQWTAFTDDSGQADLHHLPSHFKKLSIEADGFSPYVEDYSGNPSPVLKGKNVLQVWLQPANSSANPPRPPYDSQRVLSTVTFPVSDVAKYSPHFESEKYPQLATLCSTRLNPADSDLSLGMATLTPALGLSLSITCTKDPKTAEFAPRAKVTVSAVSGDRSFMFENGSANPSEQYRLTPALTRYIDGAPKPSPRTFNLVVGDSQQFFVKAPLGEFYFEYQPSDCVDQQGNPITDMRVVYGYKDGCVNEQRGGRIKAKREDLVSTSTDGSGNTMAVVRYQIRDTWIVITLDDGTGSGLGTVVVQHIPVALTGKSGEPIWEKDHFGSTVDEVAGDVTEAAFPDGQPIKAGAYTNLSQSLVRFFSSLDSSSSGQNILHHFGDEPLYPAVRLVGPSWRPDLGISFGYQTPDAQPTNNVHSWHSLPWPQDTPITLKTVSHWYTDAYTYFDKRVPPYIDVRGQSDIVRTAPTGNLGAVLEELQAHGSDLGLVKLPQEQVQKWIDQATEAIKNTKTDD